MLGKTVLAVAGLASSVSATYLTFMPKCWKACAREAGLMCNWGDMSCICSAASRGVLANSNACACNSCGETDFQTRLGVDMREITIGCRMIGSPLAADVARTVMEGSECRAPAAAPPAPLQAPAPPPFVSAPEPPSAPPPVAQAAPPPAVPAQPPAPSPQPPTQSPPAAPTDSGMFNFPERLEASLAELAAPLSPGSGAKSSDIWNDGFQEADPTPAPLFISQTIDLPGPAVTLSAGFDTKEPNALPTLGYEMTLPELTSASSSLPSIASSTPASPAAVSSPITSALSSINLPLINATAISASKASPMAPIVSAPYPRTNSTRPKPATYEANSPDNMSDMIPDDAPATVSIVQTVVISPVPLSEASHFAQATAMAAQSSASPTGSPNTPGSSGNGAAGSSTSGTKSGHSGSGAVGGSSANQASSGGTGAVSKGSKSGSAQAAQYTGGAPRPQFERALTAMAIIAALAFRSA